MKQRGSSARRARIAVRLSKEEQRQVEESAKTKGYANPSAFIRAAIRNEVDGRAELTGTDERMGAGFDRVSHDIFRVGRGQQVGDSEGLLNNARYLNEAVSELLKRGLVPTEDGWGGWLGRYQSALREAASKTGERVKGSRHRRRDRTPDRER